MLNVFFDPLEKGTIGRESIFPRGAKAEADFTGEGYVNLWVPRSEGMNYAVGDVVFEPGCRNHWHTHPTRQIL